MTAVTHQQVQWYYLPAVGDPNLNPTTAEIGAGDRIKALVNYTSPGTEAEVDTSTTDSSYDTSVVGTSKVGPIVLTIQRDDEDETDTWDLFTFRDTGFLLRSPFGDPDTGAKVSVYPVQAGRRREAGFSKNAVQADEISFYVTDEPNVDAVVDGS